MLVGVCFLSAASPARSGWCRCCLPWLAVNAVAFWCLSTGHKPLDIIITLCAVSATGGSPTDATIRRAVGMPRTSSAVHSKRWVQRPVADAVLPTTVNAAAGKMRGVYSVTPEVCYPGHALFCVIFNAFVNAHLGGALYKRTRRRDFDCHDWYRLNFFHCVHCAWDRVTLSHPREILMGS